MSNETEETCNHDENDWLWTFSKDTAGDGMDCSFYTCRECGTVRYPEDMPRQTNGGF